VLAFPGIFKGALSVRARQINEPMKMAAALAIANLVTPAQLNEDYVIPSALDPKVHEAVSKAVAQTARETGVARLA
jgi:malate dehydrogenase (oxaloacetate-decarboxylating)